MWNLIQPFLTEIFTGLTTAACSGVMVYLKENQKTKQVLDVLDRSKPKNNDFLEIALNAGLKAGAKAISKIVK